MTINIVDQSWTARNQWYPFNNVEYKQLSDFDGNHNQCLEALLKLLYTHNQHNDWNIIYSI